MLTLTIVDLGSLKLGSLQEMDLSRDDLLVLCPISSLTFLLLLAFKQGHHLHFFIKWHHIIHINHCGGMDLIACLKGAFGVLFKFLLIGLLPLFAGFLSVCHLLFFVPWIWLLSASPMLLPRRAPRPFFITHCVDWTVETSSRWEGGRLCCLEIYVVKGEGEREGKYNAREESSFSGRELLDSHTSPEFQKAW